MTTSAYQFLTQQTENGVLILTFTQPLLNAGVVAEAVTAINAANSRKVILDWQSIQFVVSASLYPDQAPFEPLLNLNSKLTEAGARLVLCNVAPGIADVFRITRLAEKFEIQPDIETALACMNE